MSEGKEIDWYSIARLNSEQFDIQVFDQIVSNTHPEIGIDRVSLQYRKKLLVMFQNASKIIKSKTPCLLADNSEMQVKRSIVADKLYVMEAEVQQSFKEIANLKIILAEKKRFLSRLREKLKKKGKKQAYKVYCCTICSRQDFDSVEAFKEHVERDHRDMMRASGEGSYQMNDLKELLMTMKDKEMEMMSMFLRASRQFQTEKLEKQYQNEYKRFMGVSGTKTDQSKQQVEAEELKGQSQFLFFQKSDQFRREMERDQQFRRKLGKQKQQRQTLQAQFYQPNNYYNVFGSIQENSSEHVPEVKKLEKKGEAAEEGQAKSYGYYDPTAFLQKFLQRQQQQQSVTGDSRYTLVENNPPPFVELRQTKINEKESVYAAPSISDRLKLQINKKSTHYETMYSTKRKFHEDKGYAFNSGPLLDDKGEGSDYQDYFGKDKPLNVSIQDEEIKMNQIGQNASGYQLGRDSFFLSKLLSPKNQSNNSLLDKSLKEKNSELVELQVSDSFSKRDFELSKDDQTINLSDLKLSKLQKKREEEKLNRLSEKDMAQQKISVNVKELGVKDKRQQSLNILAQYERKGAFTSGEGRISVLKQFERPRVEPLVQPSRQMKGNKRELDQYIRK